MGNGMDKVLPGLYLGNIRDAKDMDQLTKNHITHILSIHDSAQPDPDRHELQFMIHSTHMVHKTKKISSKDYVHPTCIVGFVGVIQQYLAGHHVYKHIHAADSPDQEISGYFQESINFIHNCRINNGVVLVHCMAGISRSTAIVAAYIMAVTQLNWKDALKAIKCSRSIANPNYGFQRQLQDFYNLQAAKERERLKSEFPDVDFKDEEYLKELLAKSEEPDISDEDSIPDALSRQSNRRKMYSANDTSQDSETTTVELES